MSNATVTEDETLVVLTEHILPALGCLAAWILFCAPFLAVRKARRNGKLGDLNPVAWPIMTASSSGFIAYGYLIRNYYVVVANLCGVAVGLYSTLAAIRHGSEEQVNRIERSIGGWTVWLLATTLVAAVPMHDDPDAAQYFLGSCCTLTFIAFTTSPLTSLFEIIKTRNAVYARSPFRTPTYMHCGRARSLVPPTTSQFAASSCRDGHNRLRPLLVHLRPFRDL
eukprot:1620453-Prymnesium_polylepis.1